MSCRVTTPMTITDAMLLSSSVAEDDAPVWSAGTTYTDGDRVIYNHRVYVSTADSNTGNTPDAVSGDIPWWIDEGPTNRWACLDLETSTKTTSSGSLTMQFRPGRFGTLALIDMQATSVEVHIESPVDGVLYDETILIRDTSAIPNWYGYFYDPIRKPKELVIDDLIPIGDAVVTLTIHNTAGNVSVGTVVFGFTYELGLPEHGASAGIVDYSKKETDDFGVTTFVRRNYSKRAELRLELESAQVDYVHTVLAELRATPCLYRGTSGIYTVLTVFGFYRDFSIDIAYPTISYCSLTLEGLT